MLGNWQILNIETYQVVGSMLGNWQILNIETYQVVGSMLGNWQILKNRNISGGWMVLCWATGKF